MFVGAAEGATAVSADVVLDTETAADIVLDDVAVLDEMGTTRRTLLDVPTYQNQRFNGNTEVLEHERIGFDSEEDLPVDDGLSVVVKITGGGAGLELVVDIIAEGGDVVVMPGTEYVMARYSVKPPNW